MADPTIFSTTFIDDAGVTATAILYVDYDGALTTVNDLLDAAVAWAALIDPLSDARAKSVTVAITQQDPAGVKAAPVADSTVERTGLFSYSQIGSAYIYSQDIPAIADSLVSNGKIDLTAATVIAYVNRMQNQADAFPAQSKAGNAVNKLLHAVMSFRKRRKQRVKASFESV
jgi:hypothetical protein